MAPSSAFGTFVPTRGSRGALDACMALASRTVGAPRVLLLHGPPGVGKTHLLHVVHDRFRRRRAAGAIVHTTARELVEEMIDAVRRRSFDEPWRRCATARLLLLDDLHVLGGRPVTQREVARLLEPAVAAGARIVGVCGRPAEVPVLVTELRRVRGLRSVGLRPPNRADILRILASARAERLDPETLRSIVTGCGGDVRRALGALSVRRLQQRIGVHHRSLDSRR
jgi:chromosomal replication initiator protein